MFSVVAVHVLTFGLNIDPATSTLCVLRGAFTMPLFFLVSGFFLYRPLNEWTRGRVWRTFKVRFVAMVVGCFIFATLYEYFRHAKYPWSWVYDGDLGAYWFTFTLFQMFLYYLIAVGIARMCRVSLLIPLFILSVIAPVVTDALGVGGGKLWSYWFCSKHTVLYFQYVLAGMLIRKYQEKFFGFLMKRWVPTVLIVGYIGACTLYINSEALQLGEMARWVKMSSWGLAKYFGAFLVLNIFYYHRAYFDGEGWFVSFWRKVGRRTLDIYYIHYFLLPKLHWVKPYISEGNTILPELVVACLIAAVIVVLSMAIGSLLRRAPLLRNLLGVKGTIPVEPVG